MSEETEQKPERMNILQALAAARVAYWRGESARAAAHSNSEWLTERGIPHTTRLTAACTCLLHEQADAAFAEAERRYAAILKACEGMEFDGDGNAVPNQHYNPHGSSPYDSDCPECGAITGYLCCESGKLRHTPHKSRFEAVK